MMFACGVPDFSGIAEALSEAFAQHEEHVVVPDLVVGGSAPGDYSLAGGVAWGTKTTGFLAGIDVQRVLLDFHHDSDRSLLAITYGRYGSMDPVGLAIDLGAAADPAGAGAAGRVQLGVAGFFIRASGEAMIDPHARLDGRIEAMVDLTTLVGAL